METVERIVTSAPAKTVWLLLADVEHWMDWTPTILEVKPLTDGGLRVGARYRVTQPGLQPGVYEVTDCTPNVAFTWVQKLLGGELVAAHRIETRDGATQVELSFSSKGLLTNIATTLLSKKIRDLVATEARSLKNRCDAMVKS
ncbi:SRPBCC family protein [Tunturibacter psychrotolerans]|uniref:SRPBCC family protein n=1 Tax=Tunturiibacter psychrotolerans TaxID=3069686 RepID=A0AAU7ZTJ9_9BACT